jgi:biopolymer transport protein ExbD
MRRSPPPAPGGPVALGARLTHNSRIVNRPPKPLRLTLNLAPMVDVMMCLIIFFLLAAKMVAAEHYPVELARAAAARRVDPGDLGRRVTITVRYVPEQDDVAEYVVADWDGRQIVERVLGPGEVEGLLRARAAHAAQDNTPLRCVVRADRMVMYRHVEVVLRACGLARLRDVVFSVNQVSPAVEAPGPTGDGLPATSGTPAVSPNGGRR